MHMKLGMWTYTSSAGSSVEVPQRVVSFRAVIKPEAGRGAITEVNGAFWFVQVASRNNPDRPIG